MRKSLLMPFLFISYFLSAQTGIVKIGDLYQGGKVFYVTPNGLHGLIVETQDQGIGSWHEAQDLVSDPQNHSFDGKFFTDWKLPTKSQLKLLYAQKDVIGGLKNTFYWSSTERRYQEGEDAWTLSFSNGSESGFDKDFSESVRSIRTF